MPTPTFRNSARRGLSAALRRPPLLLAGLSLTLAAVLSPAAHAQEREPVYSPERGGAPMTPTTPGATEAQEADWPARVGRIAEVQGTARLLDRDANEWVAATVNRPVTGGDQFATQPGGRLEISIGSTTLRLDGDTELVLQRLDDEALVLQLRRGSVAVAAVSADMAAQIEVQTREGRFRLREPGSYRIDQLDDTSHATAWRGTLRFEGRDSLLVVARGQHAEIWLEGRATHYRWAEDRRDDFAAWVARDELAAERSISARHVSPEMTGWQDLDRNGQWETHPEYGAIWTPTVVPVGWAPYRSGHWAWIAPWGWTWIDDARWGFAPFHYGRWVHYNRRWCWVPGHRSVRPVYSPALVAWVGGGRVSVGIGSSVGWVPLGPRDAYHRQRWPDRGPDRGHDRGPDRGRDRGNDRGNDRQPIPTAPRSGPAGHAVFSNQAVPGAVTTLSPDAFAGRRVVAVVGSGSTVSTRGNGGGAPFTAVAPPPAPPRLAGGGRDDSNRRVFPAPFQRDAAPAPEAERTPPMSAPERAMTPPRVNVPTPRAADADNDADHRRGRGPGDGAAPGRSAGEGTFPRRGPGDGGMPGHRGAEAGRAPFSAPVSPPPAAAPAAPPAAPPAAAPPPAAPRVAPPMSAPRTPAEAPRGQPPAREREREDSGRQRGPEPRENMRERALSR